jgi:hypothetical protein
MQTILNAAKTAQGREQVAAAAVAAANVTTKSIQQLEQITMAGQDAVLAYQRQQKAEKNVTAQEASDGLFSGGTNNPAFCLEGDDDEKSAIACSPGHHVGRLRTPARVHRALLSDAQGGAQEGTRLLRKG